MKLSQGRFRLGIMKKFFTERVDRHWNSLSRDVVTAPSLLNFEKDLDNAFRHMFFWVVLCEVRSWTG